MGLLPSEIETIRSLGAYECSHPTNPFYMCFFQFIGPNDEVSHESFPKYVYRYFDKQEYAEDLLSSGKIRLGSLLGYANAELYDGTRHDEAEGQAGFHSKFADGPFAGFPYTYLVTSQDCWVLCTSTECSARIAERFQSPFCVRITLQPFALALARAMAGRSDVGGAGAVRYSAYAGGRRMIAPDEARPVFARMHKRPKHAPEKEVRIWFEPREHRDTNRKIETYGKTGTEGPTTVDPILITSNELTRFCKRVSVH